MRKITLTPQQQLVFIPYKPYMQSPYFQRLRNMVGVGYELCERCHKEIVVIPHHLTYQTLTRETKKDVVGVCRKCNKLAQFFDNGNPVPLDEKSLRKRWKEINSFSYKFRHVHPSEVIDTLIHWVVSMYTV